MNILADENMPLVEHLFAPLTDQLRLMPGREISAEDLTDIDVLLVRSVTQVNEQLLANSRVRFVGSATIGVDHLDIDWLKSRGIEVHHSPGCNAESVVDYVLAALEFFGARQGIDWTELTVGVIGCGNVGGRLVNRLSSLGVTVLKNDPPKQQQGEAGFISLEALLSQSDIVCCHTPLNRTGPFKSEHLINDQNLKLLKPGALLLNAGRGPVISEAALLSRLENTDHSFDVHLVLDVWETEPLVNPALLARCLLATPHIAGYSLDGRIRGTWMLYQRFCQWSGQQAGPEPVTDERLPVMPAIGHSLDGPALRKTLIEAVYSIEQDDLRMRQALNGCSGSEGRRLFDWLRKNYPVRREFSRLEISGLSESQKRVAAALGFNAVG